MSLVVAWLWQLAKRVGGLTLEPAKALHRRRGAYPADVIDISEYKTGTHDFYPFRAEIPADGEVRELGGVYCCYVSHPLFFNACINILQ